MVKWQSPFNTNKGTLHLVSTADVTGGRKSSERPWRTFCGRPTYGGIQYSVKRARKSKKCSHCLSAASRAGLIFQ